MKSALLTVNPSRKDSGGYPLCFWRRCPSQSPWCNAVVLVRKKDGTLRFCVDFRGLNVRTKKDSYPLPRIQEALESMASATHFSSMDFKSGFWQMKMVPGSQPYTAFTVGNLGFYEFTRMPFGLCNMPATFQRLMQNTRIELDLLRHLSRRCHCFRAHGGGTPGMPVSGVRVLQRIQFEAEAL